MSTYVVRDIFSGRCKESRLKIMNRQVPPVSWKVRKIDDFVINPITFKQTWLGNCDWLIILSWKYVVNSRWLLRFEFQLPHPILSPALATDKKWPLSQFHISYQNSEISWPKVTISDFQSQFSMSKIIRKFQKKNFIEEYHFRDTFFVIDIF